MPKSRSNKQHQGAERRQRLSSHKVTEVEAATNPRERGRAGLTRLTGIGEQGVFDDIHISPGVFTNPKPRKRR